MVLRCVWGECNGDERYPDRVKLKGNLIPFPKPKKEKEKCLRWIRACGRRHAYLNINRVNKHTAVCSTHFVGGKGPTIDYPDPINGINGTPPVRRRPPPKIRTNKFKTPQQDITEISNMKTDENCKYKSSTSQTDNQWVSAIDFLALAAENKELHSKLKICEEKLQKPISNFGVEHVLAGTHIKDLFRYYTGITFIRFVALLNFLIPSNVSLHRNVTRHDVRSMSNKDGLFLTLFRLRHNFGLKDLSMRFCVAIQSAGIILNTWIEHMYFMFGQLSIWPHRDIIINNMPMKFKKDYPKTLVIIDATELKTQTPSSMGLQSQLYSDYKSNTTLKGLIACDPNGSVIFISELYSGSISDKQITQDSGFYELLSKLLALGYINEGDAVIL
ncbi:uncharacterized protein LOC117101338 [Anneissia japonica]|uniref:uncharacterized protein LOC117101338 n=1 Tax=Anneissia japonica TaxID=1529436 RepID=UPI001425942A|nr:uncharacterized protein LOC117101338 [Anneissia japonica]